jgi:hypothetical protein
VIVAMERIKELMSETTVQAVTSGMNESGS